MQYGIVKTVARDRGFGFIVREGGQDIFFHASVVEGAVFDTIEVDQPVMFELAKRDKEAEKTQPQRPSATIVKLIDKIPGGILNTTPQELAPRHHPKARQRKPSWKRRAGEPGPDAQPQDAPPSTTPPPTEPPPDSP